jgi:hypothetical protein
MLKQIIKISCLAFTCIIAGYMAAMIVQFGNPAPLSIDNYLGTASAGELYSPDGAPAVEGLQPRTQNGINYISGGIGDEERAQIQAVKGNYSLHIMMATSNGDFTGDTSVTIKHASNNVLEATSAGPLFYANLPSGTYKVALTRKAVTREQTVVIKQSKPVYLVISL